MTLPITQPRIGSLDFADVKSSIQNFMKQQTEFTDYSFEGSGLSQMINVLAYNTHYDALAANFLANEVFLDTATLRSSVVSRAKELGYTTTSRRASVSNLDITVFNLANNPPLEIIHPGSIFVSAVNENTFSFTNIKAITLTPSSGTWIGSATVYEGILTQNTVQYDLTRNLIPIPDLDIDTSTLTVQVYDQNTGRFNQYYQINDFISISATSNVYVLQEGFNGFEIYFGDNVLGNQPANGVQIILTYIISSGASANGCQLFTLSSALDDAQSSPQTTISITASTSAGGADIEDISSIRFNAQSNFGLQNRCVVASDYSTLTKKNFSFVSDVKSWDGSDNIPPMFGQVILSCIPNSGDNITSAQKDAISTFLKTKSVGNIKITFIDPTYINLIVNTSVTFDINQLTSSALILQSAVISTILNYIKTSTSKFDGIFRYSPMISDIDLSDQSILSNQTSISLKSILPVIKYTANNFKFSFGNSVLAGSLISTTFQDNISNNIIFLSDDSMGNINSYYYNNLVKVLYKSSVGSIDYVSGNVSINNIIMSSVTNDIFSITINPVKNDIISNNNVLFVINQADISVTLVQA